MCSYRNHNLPERRTFRLPIPLCRVSLCPFVFVFGLLGWIPGSGDLRNKGRSERAIVCQKTQDGEVKEPRPRGGRIQIFRAETRVTRYRGQPTGRRNSIKILRGRLACSSVGRTVYRFELDVESDQKQHFSTPTSPQTTKRDDPSPRIWG